MNSKKRKLENIDKLCNNLDKLFPKKQDIKQYTLEFGRWNNIFKAPSFEKKSTYTNKEICEILNKHDSYLLSLYIESTKLLPQFGISTDIKQH